MRSYEWPWAYTDEAGWLYHTSDVADVWTPLGKDEPQPDTPRNPLPKPKEPPPPPEPKDPREDWWA